MIQFKYLPLLFFVLIINSCAKNKNKSGAGHKSEIKPDSKLSEPVEPAEEKIVKVDAKKLFVFNVRVTKLNKQLESVLSLSYDPDGRADYLEYMICPLEKTDQQCREGEEIVCAQGGECVPGITVHNRVVIPKLHAGRVQIKVKACIERERALSQDVCGNWEEKEYYSSYFDQRIAHLYGRALTLKKSLGNLVEKDYRNALQTFTEEGRACDLHNAEVDKVLKSKVRVVEQFLRAPASWFKASGENLGDAFLGEGGTQEVIGAISDLGKKISKELDKICQSIADTGAAGDFSCKLFRGTASFGKTMLGAISPVTAVGTLSNSIHDVYYGTFKGEGDKLVAKGCHAEANLQRTVYAIETQMQYKIQELGNIKKELQFKGESTVIPSESN